jgi:hypothetical protein
MKFLLSRHKPLWIALAVWLAVVAVELLVALNRTGGALIYGLDDAYIHLAIAKHFMEGGIWGVTPYAFSSSSSSPIWPLLLAAGGKIFGNLDLLPFGINLCVSIFLIVEAYAIALRLGWHGWKTAVFPLTMAFLLPAVPLVMNGMEAILFAALALAFVETSVQYLLDSKSSGKWPLAAWGIALTSVRYEGLFIVVVICLLLFARRQMGTAIAVGAIAILPAVWYAVVSMSLGWYALPNSLMIKHAPIVWSDPSSYWQMVARIFLPISDTLTSGIPRWNSILYAVVALLTVRIAAGLRVSIWSRPALSSIIFICVAILHGMLIASEWQFRYAGYLMAIGCWTIASLLNGMRWPVLLRAETCAAVAIGCLVGYPLLNGALSGLIETPQAARNIFEQQWQMGSFLKENYDGQSVVVNDIGVVDFLANLHLVDAYGLASLPVARAKQTGAWEQIRTSILRDQARVADADVAVLFDSWFNHGADIPHEWVRITSWTIRENVVSGSDTVTWYATNAASAVRLRAQLEMYRAQLPQDVSVQEFDLP